MTRKVVPLLAVIGAVLGTAGLYAHHSPTAEFDSTKTITVQGTITKVEMTNPHGWIHLNVKGPDGRVKNYAFQTSAPSQLIRRGADKKIFAVGSTVILEGWHARDGSNTAFCRSIKTVDGETIFSFDAAGNASTAVQ